MSRALRAELARAFEEALGSIDLEGRVRDALGSVACVRGRVRIIAVGKAAPAMMRGALARFPKPARALVIAPDGVAAEGLPRNVDVLRAAHPLPDNRSLTAASEAFRAVRSANDDLVIALISGGASSLVCAPFGIGLAEKRALVDALLRSGADIQALNTVRRHLSRIKGGGLARAAAPARVLGLLASDVLDGRAYDIGSGPTVYDPTTRADALAVLERYAPHLAHVPLRESLGPAEIASSRLRSRIVIAPQDLAHAMRDALSSRGFVVHVEAPSGASVEALAAEYVTRARALRVGHAVVRAAEPTVVVACDRPGRGGRSSHLAALVGSALPVDVAFLAGASDGADGSGDAAGAAVDADAFATLGPRAIADALATFSTADLHLAAGTSLDLGKTGLNLADVHVLARASV